MKPHPHSRSLAIRWGSFAACCLVIAFIWCIVLPRLAQLWPVREHIRAMEQGKINVSAMFYTELEWQPPTGAAWR